MPQHRPRVLVVDDDRAVRESLRRSLEFNGYDVALAADGADALAGIARSAPDAVVMDVMMPRLDGIEATKALRSAGNDLPILVLTARDTVGDRVEGLDAGATDYITKPFSTHILLARLRAHLRGADATSSGELVFGELRIDVDGFRVFLGPTELPLRPKEIALLVRLASSAGRVISREQLLDDVWDMSWDSETKTLEVHIHALRRKLGSRAEGRPWISTVRTFGYRFEP